MSKSPQPSAITSLSKLERIQRHFDQVIDVNVILSVEKLQQKAEISVHMRGKDIHVESDDADMYAAIDPMMDKLDRQIIKHKEKAYAHPHDALKRAKRAGGGHTLGRRNCGRMRAFGSAGRSGSAANPPPISLAL